MLTGNDVAILLGFLAAAVTLAGFSGIVTSIDRGAAPVSSDLMAFRVSQLVLIAILSAFLAFLPVLLDALELLPDTLWPFSSMVLTILVAYVITQSIFGSMRAQLFMGKNLPSGASRPMFLANVAFGVVVMIVGIAGAANQIPARGAYFLGLFYFQYLMFFLFYRMILVADEVARTKSTGTEQG